MDNSTFQTAAARWVDYLNAALRQRRVSRQQLADELGISTRNLQRRFAGDTPFTLEEYLHLCIAYQLPRLGTESQIHLEIVEGAGPSATFDADAYLSRLQGAARALVGDNLELRVITTDLPIFYFLADPDLCHLKLISFATRQGRATLALTATQIKACAALAVRFRTLARREIWGPAPLRSFFHQIERLVEERAVPPEVVARGLAALKQLASELFHNLNDQAEPLHLRINDEHATATTYSLLADGVPQETWLAHHNPDFLRAADTVTGQYFLQHFNHQWAGAREVSESSRTRLRFFTDFESGIDRRSERVLGKLNGEGG